MKYIVIVPDGMADYPIARIGNKTPLEAAKTPNMDFLAQQGVVGQVQTIPDGMKPGSDIGNMAILGYDPKICHTGRAPLFPASAVSRTVSTNVSDPTSRPTPSRGTSGLPPAPTSSSRT